MRFGDVVSVLVCSLSSHHPLCRRTRVSWMNCSLPSSSSTFPSETLMLWSHSFQRDWTWCCWCSKTRASVSEEHRGSAPEITHIHTHTYTYTDSNWTRASAPARLYEPPLRETRARARARRWTVQMVFVRFFFFFLWCFLLVFFIAITIGE